MQTVNLASKDLVAQAHMSHWLWRGADTQEETETGIGMAYSDADFWRSND